MEEVARIEDGSKDTIDINGTINTKDTRLETVQTKWQMVEEEQDPAKTFGGLM